MASADNASSGTQSVRVLHSSAASQVAQYDRVAIEAPLEIFLHHATLGAEALSFGTTMRTPGDDESLAAGLLYGEGIVNKSADIEAIESSTRRPNVVHVRLHAAVQYVPGTPLRLFSAGSSCGICGTTGLDAAIARAAATHVAGAGRVALSLLLRLPPRMRAQQSKFGDTGGVHACALFDLAGNLLKVAEDVGRHNAFDKLVGMSLMAGHLPLTDRIVVLSGRASFELAQKAIRAGATILAAIGAPSSLAVSLASASGITLAGFLREAHCNVYSHPERLMSESKPAS